MLPSMLVNLSKPVKLCSGRHERCAAHTSHAALLLTSNRLLLAPTERLILERKHKKLRARIYDDFQRGAIDPNT